MRAREGLRISGKQCTSYRASLSGGALPAKATSGGEDPVGQAWELVEAHEERRLGLAMCMQANVQREKQGEKAGEWSEGGEVAQFG